MLRVGLCQTAVGSSKTENLGRAGAAVARCVAQGARMVVLPECFNCPYANSCFPVYAEPVPPVGGQWEEAASPSIAFLASTAKEHSIHLVGGSIPEKDAEGRLFNTCAVFDPQGKMVAKFRKLHLFDIDIPDKITFRESDTLSPGDSLATFDVDGRRIGIGICYDMRFPELAQHYALRLGCGMILYPGAFNTTTGPRHWELLQRARALDNNVFVATVSPARAPEPDAVYHAWGHSSLISPWGDVLASTDHKPAEVVHDVDWSELERVRAQIPTLQQKRTDVYSRDGPSQ